MIIDQHPKWKLALYSMCGVWCQFVTSVDLWNHYHNEATMTQWQNNPVTTERSLHAFYSHIHCPHLTSNHQFVFRLYNFVILRRLHKWNHTVCDIWGPGVHSLQRLWDVSKLLLVSVHWVFLSPGSSSQSVGVPQPVIRLLKDALTLLSVWLVHPKPPQEVM